jgi:predicted SAM-dependent methyltransferase
MLQNIFDCLIPGGVLRLATPNLRNIANVYLNPSLEELSSFKIDFSQHGIDIRFPPDLLKATFNNFGHQFGYIYDFETLQKLLEEIGFIGVEKFKPGKSNIDSLKNIENRIGESDQWGQLCLEATKPNHLSA